MAVKVFTLFEHWIPGSLNLAEWTATHCASHLSLNTAHSDVAVQAPQTHQLKSISKAKLLYYLQLIEQINLLGKGICSI